MRKRESSWSDRDRVPDRRLVVRLLLAVLLVACSFPAIAQTAMLQFLIGEFTISVRNATLAGVPVHPENLPRPSSLINRDLGPFKGEGTTKIRDQDIGVTFSNVMLRIEGEHHLPVAVGNSIVTGTIGPNVEYRLDSFAVSIRAHSVRLSVSSSSATVRVSLPQAPFFAAEAPANFLLSSTSCSIAPDGSVVRNNFTGVVSFLLKDSVYQLQTVLADKHTVNLGSSFTEEQYPKKGIQLGGMALRDETVLFKFRGTISPSAQVAAFTLQPVGPLERVPEPNYKLKLLSGSVSYIYNATGLGTCEGSFIANLGLPKSVRNESNDTIALSRILLKTDRTGILFGFVDVPGKLKAGYSLAAEPSIFLLSTAKQGAWVYFPIWHLKAHSSYPVQDAKKPENCQEIIQFLDTGGPENLSEPHNIYGRPGLTILRGTLFFKSPQVKFTGASPSGSYTLKTLFWGALTLTPWGVAGELTSSGCSLIPANQEIAECGTPTPLQHYTWQQMIDMGKQRPEQKPQDPKERFTLEGLRILDMRIEKLPFCSNQIISKEASFLYSVHFPFPSFIDLDFQDQSLDSTGRFQTAKGPIAPRSWIFQDVPGQDDIGGSPQKLPRNVKVQPLYVDRFFWAWRLPAAFSDRGVEIDYPDTVNEKTVVEVKMRDVSAGEEELFSSEIGLRPLYSRNSGIRFGVRFSARMSPNGDFNLTGWDMSPIFAGRYANPGTERLYGFDCTLKPLSENGVILANIETLAEGDPSTRNFDFKWEGTLLLPFFGPQLFQFKVKDAVPKLVSPNTLSGKRAQSCCSESSGSADFDICPDAERDSVIINGLHATVEDMYLSIDSIALSSKQATAFLIAGSQEQAGTNGSLFMSSFTNAYILSATAERRDYQISSTLSPATCGTQTRIRQLLQNAVSSKDIVNLVCYDADAMQASGVCSLCNEDYMLGNYIVHRLDSTEARIGTLVSAPYARYYVSTSPRLELNGSVMQLQLGEDGQRDVALINIPSAKLTYDETRGTLQGDFSATSSSVAEELPYEGEFRFYLDTKCGYYYLHGLGSFAYFLRFGADIFIIHAPFSDLQAPTSFFGVTPILEALWMRSLFNTQEDFLEVTGLNEALGNTIVSGLFLAGNCSGSCSLGEYFADIATGAGFFGFQLGSQQPTDYSPGTFINVKANAIIDELEASGGGSLWEPMGDFTVKGSIGLIACDSWFIIPTLYCKKTIECSAIYSADNGLDIDEQSVHVIDHGCYLTTCD